MKVKKINVISAMAFIGTVIFVFGTMPRISFGIEKQIVFKLAGLNAPDAPLTLGEHKLSELVGKRTNNKVKIEVYPAGQLGSNLEASEAVRLGTVDLTDINISIFGKWVPALNIYGAGYLFTDRDQLFKSFESDIMRKYFEILRTKFNIRLLAFPWYGVRHVTTKDKPIYTPDDLVGQKLRVEPEEAALITLEAMGAKATPMSFSELYLALQTGVLDGQENPIPTIYAAKFYEVQKYLNLTAHKTVCTSLAMHEKSFQKLSPEYQKILIDSAKEAANYCTSVASERIESQLPLLVEKGMRVINSDKESFRKKTLPIVFKFIEEKYITDKDSFKEFRKLIK